MCGITGAAWSRPELSVDPQTLRRMTAALQHRGPDDSAEFFSSDGRHRHSTHARAALGFRRLSIVDLAGGAQPMANEDYSVQLVVNGEIYNHIALRKELEAKGHKFRSQSDSEVILHLFEEHDVDCFQRLNGMFAIAIWDDKQKRLVLARDRMGQKPLFFCKQDGRLAFASEIKSLRELPGLQLTIDPAAVDDFLTHQYVPYPKTIYREIAKLAPGHLAVYSNDQLEIDPYWTPDWNLQTTLRHSEAIELTQQLLTESVEMRLQGNVPLGVFLSGGIDSSLLTALMAQKLQHPVKSFSIGFAEPEYDESQFAREFAQKLNLDHHELIVREEAAELVARLARHYDEPFADSSAIPTWIVSQFAREQVTVALSGDGGDELYAGYPRYKAVAIAEKVARSGLGHVLTLPFWKKLPGMKRKRGFMTRLQKFASGMGKTTEARYLEWISIFKEVDRDRLYTSEFAAQVRAERGEDHTLGLGRESHLRDAVTIATHMDIRSYLPGALLTKVDVASMAHGLECRQPFLDHRLVELAISMPMRWKLRRGRGKRILKDAFGPLLPDAIWQRKKRGFSVPLDHWFRGQLYEFAHDMLLSPTSEQFEFFRPEEIKRMLEEHRTGASDHSDRLWSLIMFEQWRRTWHG